MGTLNFQNPKKTYIVNDGAEIHFNPADVNFVSRLFDLMGRLEARQKEEIPADPEDVFKIAAQRDAELREEIDAVFEEPVCDKVFGSTNLFSPAGGVPVCLNFLMAVIDEIDAAAEAETKTSPAVAAYVKKYESKYGKYSRK